MKDTIYFYSTTDAHGAFSNFARYGFELDGTYWKTAEHYFQAQKFAGTKHEIDIQRAHNPKQAAQMGRDRSRPLRKDWEDVKDDVMRRAVLKKFETHDDIRRMLLDTGDADIVENAPGDYYWGCGQDGSGKNMLGKILMETRAILREKQHAKESE